MCPRAHGESSVIRLVRGESWFAATTVVLLLLYVCCTEVACFSCAVCCVLSQGRWLRLLLVCIQKIFCRRCSPVLIDSDDSAPDRDQQRSKRYPLFFFTYVSYDSRTRTSVYSCLWHVVVLRLLVAAV